MLGQFTRQDQSNGRLDFSGRHGRLLVVSGQLGGFSRDLFEDVVDEGVHDAIALRRCRSPVHLLQDLVDVDLVGFDLLLGRRLVTLDGFLAGFLPGCCMYVSVLWMAMMSFRIQKHLMELFFFFEFFLNFIVFYFCTFSVKSRIHARISSLARRETVKLAHMMSITYIK